MAEVVARRRERDRPGLVSHDQTSMPVPEQLCLYGAHLEDGGQLDQLRLVLIGVVLAEQQLGPGRQLCPYASSSTAAIAAVSPRQLGTGERCVHGTSR
jgi:hypothetical protein